MITATQKASTSDWEEIRKTIHKGQNFLITTHVQADPDALGSELALSAALRSLGKNPVIVNPTPISKNYAFLDSAEEIQVFAKDDLLSNYQFDAVFILDISRWERLGLLADPIRDCGKTKICIDHHPYSGGYADLHIINLEACASAEIIYDLIHYLDIPVSRRIAELIYASILSDTGAFSFSNTSARAHNIACELLNYGIQSRKVFEQLYQNHSPDRLKFLGKALSNLQLDCDQQLAWITIPYRMLVENEVLPEDTEGFVDIPRNCKEVLLSILFLEVQPNDVKISLRSKGNFNSNQLAARFGGGGHYHASGIRLTGSLPEIEQALLSEARKAIDAVLS
jgi:bifunctional oligoribonuclease and PAP phosphatase NrnA